MATANIAISSRAILNKRENKRLRKAGIIPGCVGIKGKNSISITTAAEPLRKTLNKFGKSAVFKLKLDGKKTYDAMLSELQIVPSTGEFLNAAFIEVSLKEEIKRSVPIRVINAQVLEFNKMIQSVQTETLTVLGLPQDIPNYIEIDGEMLFEKGSIFLSDLKLPKDLTFEDAPDTMLVSASAIKVVEEETEEVETIAAEDGEKEDEQPKQES